jgi:hypothetical protein
MVNVLTFVSRSREGILKASGCAARLCACLAGASGGLQRAPKFVTVGLCCVHLPVSTHCSDLPCSPQLSLCFIKLFRSVVQVEQAVVQLPRAYRMLHVSSCIFLVGSLQGSQLQLQILQVADHQFHNPAVMLSYSSCVPVSDSRAQ